MNERAVLRRLRGGDAGALSELIRVYTPYLCAVASNIMAPPLQREDVEEAVSDAFVQLWAHRDEVQTGRLKPWLAAVTRNRALDALRRAHAAEPLDDDLLEIAAPGQIEERVLQAELRALAREAVDSLGEPDSEIFRRHYFLYQKTEDIAAALGMSGATVRTKLARGRERLRTYFSERGYSCADPHF